MDKLAEELCSTLNDFMTCDHMPHLVFLPINALMLMMAIAFMEYWSNSNKVLVQLISLTPPPPSTLLFYVLLTILRANLP